MARILIVDDDKNVRAMLEAALRRDPVCAAIGLEISTADDGQNGLAAFAEHRPEVVIVDLMMPRIDGFECCRSIRDTPSGMSIDLVVMSGIHKDAAIRTKVAAELNATFFAKPGEIKELVAHVGRVLNRRRASTVVAASATGRPSPEALGVEVVADVRSGDLALRPLPAVLLDLNDAQVTGRLTLRRGRIAKVIDLADGHPIGATSSARDETLGHFLVGSGVITDDQHKQAVARAVELREKVGEALVAMGALSPQRLAEQLTAQARHKLVQALRWPQGAWRFESRTAGDDGLRLDMVHVVLAGLRDTAPRGEVPDTVGRLAGQQLELTERGKRLAPDLRRVFGGRLIDGLRDGVTVADLEDIGAERGELYAMIDTMVWSDALTTRLPSVGPGFADALAASRMGSARHVDAREASVIRTFDRPRAGGGFGTGVGTGAGTGTGSDPEHHLYELLFEDSSVMTPLPGGDAPIEIEDDEEAVPQAIAGPGDSGAIALGEAATHAAQRALDEAGQARRALIKEFLRIQGVDHYAALLVGRQATPAELAAALAERQSRFSRDFYARFGLGRDQAKLDDIHAAYDAARAVLLDDQRRATYDRELAGGELMESAPSLDAELAYRAGEELLARRQWPAAIGRLQAAVAAAPDEADYHAALGWAHWLAGGGDTRAADSARPHLNQALSINPDHAAAHEYKGRIDAQLATDDVEAAFHLERALELDSTRGEALIAFEEVCLRRGEVRPLERLYRRLIYRATGSQSEATLWVRLGALYRDHLQDLGAARLAYAAALKVTPGDTSVAAAAADLERSAVRGADHQWEELRGRWRRDTSQPGPGIALVHHASSAQRHDAAFLAAAALVARDLADADATALFQRHRPRFVIRAQRPVSAEMWNLLRHPDDGVEVGALLELLAPAVHRLVPMTLADLEVDDSMVVGDQDLPAGFVRMRSYLSWLLGLEIPAVFVRPDFGNQLHVGAVDPPVLLAGDDALAAPERSELAFRLARAMTYVWPGRAVGGSRPARYLKAAVLATFADASPGGSAALRDDDGLIARARECLAALDDDARQAARALVVRLLARAPQLNMSRWSKGLTRTADRAGLLVCGDVPAARRFALDGGANDDDLLDFATSPAHLELRSQLGLSVDV